MLRLIPIAIFLLASTQLLYAQTGSFSGKITDQKTGEPLVGATLQLEGTSLGTVTDTAGRYTLEKIPPKTYNVTASYVGYQTLTRFNVVIRSEGNIDINLGLQQNVSQLDELVVASNPFTKLEETPLSIQKLSQEEIASYPGGNNDIAKVVQSLPGVSGSVGGFRNDVIIRGGAPNENVYYLDGVEIPNINHFATQGSAGGPVGLLNVSFFEGVTLTTSAFGAQYDNVLSGVLQFDQRNGNARQFQGNVRVGASESALTLEGPLFKKGKPESNTTFIVSARRSYLQFLFKLIGLPFLPDYWDFQYKVNHKINEYNDIYITGVASIDDLEINEQDDLDAAQQATQDQVPVIGQRTNAIGISWKKRFKDQSGFMQSTLSTNYLKNEFSRYRDNISKSDLYFNNDSREEEFKFRFNLTKFIKQWTTNYGVTAQQASYRNTTLDNVNEFSYNTDLKFYRYGLFMQSSVNFNEDRMGLALGWRMDGNTYTEQGNNIFRTFSPRVAFSYQLTKNGNWTANASVGRYYKLPPYTALGFTNNAGQKINQNLRYIRSDHMVLGIERLLGKSARLTLEGFLKLYDHYPVSVLDSVSLANKGGGFEVLGNEPVESAGKGRTYGLELLYQQKFNGKYYAIVAYTLYKSEFTGFDTMKYIPSVWDNNHLLTITAGYKLKRNWEISTRYRFLGKTPYPPVDQQATLANYPAILYDYSQLGEEQLKPFSQLDVRVDKKWNFTGWSFELFLDIQNVLSSRLPQAPAYGLARNGTGEVIQPESLVEIPADDSGSLIPSIGVVANF